MLCSQLTLQEIEQDGAGEVIPCARIAVLTISLLSSQKSHLHVLASNVFQMSVQPIFFLRIGAPPDWIPITQDFQSLLPCFTCKWLL
jgi:hypothetical protein